MFFSTIYFSDIPYKTAYILNSINLLIALFITFGASYYIYLDFKNNHYIKNNGDFNLFSLFFLFCIIASLFNGNGFHKFNNIFFIINSVLFFYLVIQDNFNKTYYLNLLNFIILLSIITITLISTATILVAISNKLSLTKLIPSKNIREYFYICCPTYKARWYTVLLNPNTYGHLVSMTFFLVIIPFKYSNKIKTKIFIIIMQLINIFVLILSGSKGALASILIGLFIIYIIYLLLKKQEGNYRAIKATLIFILVLCFATIVIIKTIPNLKNFLSLINNKILRIDTLTNGNGRMSLWSNLLHLPLISHPFGFSDNYIYNYLNILKEPHADAFINNNGRSHNMYLQVLISYGFITFIIFITCIVKTFINIIKNKNKLKIENQFLLNVFFIQFLVILVGGFFEQLPIFSLSAHSIIFMFVWANLLTLSDNK